MKGWVNSLLQFCLPVFCPVCGKTLPLENNGLCFQCLISCRIIEQGGPEQESLQKIFWGRLPVSNVLAYLKLDKLGPERAVIHDIKYSGNQLLAKQMGKAFANKLMNSPNVQMPDYVIPVPLHPKKLKMRGYNQSALIGQGMCSVWNARLLPSALIRTQHNESQTKKNRMDRWTALKDVFALDNSTHLQYRRVMLVDDVLTTGATLEACGKELLKIPGIKLSIAALAYKA